MIPICPIEYVLFDMDGLLLDTESVYTQVTNEILAPFGVQMSWDIKAGCMGKPERQAAEHLLSHFPDIDLSIETYLSERNRLQDLRWPSVQVLPGAQRLIHHLHTHNIPICVATSSRRQNLILKTAHLGSLFDLFNNHIICADDDEFVSAGMRGKPEGDIFLFAARQKLGRNVGPTSKEGQPSADHILERSKGLVLEDAVPGVQAASNAGMNVAWVPDPNLIALTSTNGGTNHPSPTQTLNSLLDFKPEEWGLPPYPEAMESVN